MTLWCCGSPAFLTAIEEISPAAQWDEQCEPAPNDHLVVDLDDPTAPLAQLGAWCAAGLRVIVACEAQTLNVAADAVRRGARFILLKPLDGEELRRCLDTAPRKRKDSSDVRAWRQQYAPEIIGESATLFAALEMAMRAAECDCPVLITGENGTGKELLARAFHRSSPRHSSPFIPVNCPAIPKELVESELFGHSKGAFTGATMARVGRFEAADHGTLLLDEIGEMDLSIQSKLLRVLQDYQITRVGESRPHQVDVRIIAATNRDLEEMVTQGTFREDLYYRLNVLQVHLPALRDRREDIPVLVDHFLREVSQQRHMPAPILSARAHDALCAYHWPGNIRQLHNIIERLVILHRGESVDLQHLPFCVTQHLAPSALAPTTGAFAMTLPPDGIDLRDALQQFEDSMIRQALTQTGGNKNQAARILGLNRTTLVEKLRKRVPIAAAG